MKYFPKSSINILEANKGEFIYKTTKRPFAGTYIETSGGRYYAGSNYMNLGPELVKPDPSSLNFGKTRLIKKYNILNKQRYNKLKKYKTIIPTKTRPTEKDYQKGYMFRYFAQKVNDDMEILEISQKAYDNFDKNYDTSLYTRGSIVWTLEGNVRKSNKLALERSAKLFPYIGRLFSILNEFESSMTTTSLFTQGGELYYKDGREYTGAYHIHPEKGPMVGAQHIEEAHDILVWAKDLQSPNELKGNEDINYESFLKDRVREELNSYRNPETRSIPDSLGTTQRSTPTTSGGEGGGY